MAKPEEKFVLPKEARMMMVSFLESQGAVDVDNVADEEILKRYNQHVLDMQKKVTNYETSSTTKNINQWMAANPHRRVEDHDFLMRLFNMNIPHYYLHLFRDEHSTYTDRDLWQIINKSGISPIEASGADPNIIFKTHPTPMRVQPVPAKHL